MGKFWSDANCAALIASYKTMPGQFRLLYWSIAAGPIILTSAAIAQQQGALGLEPAMSWFFWPLAVLYWLLMIPFITNHLRGRLALRRGVEPVRPIRKAGYFSPRWELIAMPVVILLFASLAFLGNKTHKADPTPLSMAILFSASFSTVLYQFVVQKYQLYGSSD